MGKAAGLAGAAIATGLAVGAVAVVKFGADAIGAASDLNETMSKSTVIFKDQAAVIESFGETAALNLGLSKEAAISAATSFGDMFIQMGSTRQMAAQLSQDVVILASDLGSFNNLETADVTDRISAAFRGEYDSLQALVPTINAARVEKEALAATGKDAADALTAEEKAMATLKIITEDTEAAQGDFARTSDGLANQQKILKAQFEDVRAEIGQKLLPIAVAFVEFLNEDFIPGAQDLWAELDKRLGPVLQDVGEFIRDDVQPAAKRMWEIFKDVVTVLQDNQDEFKDLLNNMKDLVGFIDDTLNPAMQEGTDYFSTLELVVAATVGHLIVMTTGFNKVADAIRAMPEPPGWLLDLIGSGFGLGNLGSVGGGGGETTSETRTPATPTPRVTLDVNLNNGIVQDPYALGQSIIDAAAQVAFTDQRVAS
jgi:hypothetical protein